MLAAIRPPIVNWRSPIRYTPIRITATVANCVSVLAAYIAPDDRPRMRTLMRARKVLTRSQRAWITPSAPCVLMVSMPARLSTSVALRCALAR